MSHKSILFVALTLCCGALFADGPNDYTGPDNGDWSADGNWSQGHVPRPDEDVGIAGMTVNAPGTIDVRSLHLLDATLLIGNNTTRPHVAPVIEGDLELAGSSRLYVYAGELTDYSVFETVESAMTALRAAANVVTIGGDFIVDDTSVVYPDAPPLTGVPVVFKVAGDFTLAEGASFKVTKRGWGWSGGAWADRPSEYCKPRKTEGGIVATGWTFAIGSGLSYSTGGQYGSTATGSSWQGKAYGKSYGPTFAPLFSGSPGGYYQNDVNLSRGPGSIVVLAEGDATINGTMNANGGGAGISHDHAGASGGGIWLAASTFSFGENVLLTAEGGLSGNNIYAPGGGGRIAFAEGCSAEEIAAMFAGTLPDGVSEGPVPADVAVSVLGGAKPNGSLGSNGSVSVVRPAGNQAVVTTTSDVAGLVADGIVWGDLTYTNGTYSFTAPQYAYLVSDSGVRYRCAGFVVSNATAQVAQGTGLTAEFTVAGLDGPYSLTWLWDERMVQVTGSIAGSGTVTYDGETYTENFEVFLPSGEPCTFTATPGEGGWMFSSWAGTAVPTGFSMENPIQIALTQSGTMNASFAQGGATRVWVGPANGSWDTPANWDPEGVPGMLDDVFLTGATVTIARSLNVNSLNIGGTSKVTFSALPLTGASTPADVYACPMVVKVADALVIDGTAVVTAANDPVTGAAVKFDCGSFCLGASATLTASEKGWFWYESADDSFATFTAGAYKTRALGAGYSYQRGGGYGANGGDAVAPYCQAYGYKYAPFLPGSPNGLYNNSLNNGNRPGGTVWVKCAGLCELYGTVSANGKGNTSGISMYGASSGGGIWICARGVKAAATTSVTAFGGYLTGGGYGSFGAGGRISLALGCTDEQLDALAAGEEPEGLSYQDSIDFFSASARGGEKAGVTPTYGNAGTVTMVTGPLADVNVTIAGSPVDALGVEPANGLESYENGSVQTFTAPEYGVDPSDPAVRYECTGYVVSNALGEVTSGAGLSVDVTIGNGPMSVTWFWGEPQNRVLARKPANGSLTVDGVAVDGDAIIWTTGQTAALGAVADDGYEFVCWEGNVPFGQARDNPLEADIDEPLDVTPVFRFAESPMTRTWSGTGVWTDETKWSPSGIPGAGDTVVIASGTCWVSNSLTVAELQVSGGTLRVGGKGPVSAELSVTGDATVSAGTLDVGHGLAWLFENNNYIVGSTALMPGHARVAVGGSLALSGTATAYVWGGPIEDNFTFASGTSFLDVGSALTLADTSALVLCSHAMSGGSVLVTAGTVTVAETAKIDAMGRGYGWLGDEPPPAPGLGYSYTIGGSHGAVGGATSGSTAKPAYDFALAPTMPGSPNGTYSSNQRPAGGVIRIQARKMTINGTLDADAVLSTWTSGSAGGSIWLAADTFVFGSNAKLTAMGGASNYNSQGGGGRIAIAHGVNGAKLAELAETGVYSGPEKRVRDEAAFRAAVKNATMTIALGAQGTTAEARNGSFAYVDGRSYNLMVIIQ